MDVIMEAVLQTEMESLERPEYVIQSHGNVKLDNIAEIEGRKCVIDFWNAPYPNGLHCNATWDTLLCWPTTPANQVASIPCKDIIRALNPLLKIKEAFAYRVCDKSGEWLWGNWTNYTECTNLLDHMTDAYKSYSAQEVTVTLISYIGFIGSILSLVSLIIALFIFCYFKSLQCNRLSVHKNLVVSFIIRFILMIIVTEPEVTGRKHTFMHTEWLCKFILAAKMYSMISNVNWMFVEGFYLHSRITVSVFNSEAPFLLFYTIGWGVPLTNVLIWMAVLNGHMTNFCWLGYSKTSSIWIIAIPLSLALLMNLIFLINIVRILVTKLRANTSVETHQIRKAIKATAVLFPLLGTTNLLFFVNPNDGGQLENAYIIVNSILQASQGIFVSILYCFLNSEVISAIHKRYVRIMLQRNPKSRRYTRRKFSRSSSFFLSQYEICTSVNQKNSKMDVIVETP